MAELRAIADVVQYVKPPEVAQKANSWSWADHDQTREQWEVNVSCACETWAGIVELKELCQFDIDMIKSMIRLYGHSRLAEVMADNVVEAHHTLPRVWYRITNDGQDFESVRELSKSKPS
jgi:hypothetical protein